MAELKSADGETNDIIARLRVVAADLREHPPLVAALKSIAEDLVKLGDRAVKEHGELETRIEELGEEVNGLEQAAAEYQETEGVVETIAEAVYDFDRGLKDYGELLTAVREAWPDRVYRGVGCAAND